MYLAFRNEETGLYVETFGIVATYIYHPKYTEDLQRAALYRKDYFEINEYGKDEPYLVSRLRIWEEKTGEKLVPVEVALALKEVTQ